MLVCTLNLRNLSVFFGTQIKYKIYTNEYIVLFQGYPEKQDILGWDLLRKWRGAPIQAYPG